MTADLPPLRAAFPTDLVPPPTAFAGQLLNVLHTAVRGRSDLPPRARVASQGRHLALPAVEERWGPLVSHAATPQGDDTYDRH
jgi:hypothetical protein